MPENSIPPAGDDDSDDLSAFDDFVNSQLDFDGEAERAAAETDNLFDDDSEDDEIVEDEDPLGRVRPSSSFGAFFSRPSAPGMGSSPPSRFASGAASSPFSQPPPSQSSMPPRIPLPSVDDRRWQDGVYSVKGDLEIYYSQPFLAMRVLVLADANRRLYKRIRYIPNIAPGWAAIEVRTSRILRGFVRTADVKLTPIPRSPAWSRVFFGLPLKLDWLDMVIITIVLLMLLFVATDIDETLFYVSKPHVEALQTQVAAQQAQLESLQAQLAATPMPRQGDR